MSNNLVKGSYDRFTWKKNKFHISLSFLHILEQTKSWYYMLLTYSTIRVETIPQSTNSVSDRK